MKKYFYLFLLLSVSIFGCSEFSSNQQAILNKKWYSSKIDCIELNNNKSYILYHREVKIREVPYEFTGDNKFKLIDTLTGNEVEYSFEVKDSVLMFCFARNTIPQNEKIDTFFYHLNSKYDYWQRRELYYYGKIISEKEPLPYIKFEF